MSYEILFIIGLFLSGLAINSVLSKSLPQWVAVTSSFFVGCINWVVLCLVYWIIANRVDVLVVMIIVLIESILFLCFSARKKKAAPWHWQSLIFPLIYFLLFCAADAMFLNFNLINASRDSLTHILMGKNMQYSGISDLIWSSPASIGYFNSLMQTPSKFLGVDYFHSIQPIFSTCFILFFFSMVYFYFGRDLGKIKASFLAILLVAFFFGSQIMQYMYSYVISNLTVGVLQFVSLFCYFAYYKEPENKGWLALGAIFVGGLSLIRIEVSIIVLVQMILVSYFIRISKKETYKFILPSIIFMFLVGLTYMASSIVAPERSLFTVTNILGLLTVQLLTIAYFFFHKVGLFEKYVAKNIPLLLTALFILCLIIAFATKPIPMMDTLRALVSAVFVMGGWGSIWPMLILWFIISWNKCKTGFFPFFKYFIPFYCSYVILLTYFSGPYHERWGGSGNRMFVQIFFICMFYLTLSLVHILNKQKSSQQSIQADR